MFYFFFVFFTHLFEFDVWLMLHADYNNFSREILITKEDREVTNYHCNSNYFIHFINTMTSSCFTHVLGFHNSKDGESSTSNSQSDIESYPLSSPDMRLSLISNFATSYNVINVSIALEIMGGIYSDEIDDSKSGKALCASALIAGMILGQLGGGAFGDWFGRHKAMSIVTIIQILSSIGSAACTFTTGSADFTIYHLLAVWRLILGFGCGGVYPLAATLTAESTATRTPEYRAKLVALTFSMQGVGYLASPLIAVLLVSILGEESDMAWRLLLGIGCVPGAGLLLVRLMHRFHSVDAQSFEQSTYLETSLLAESSDSSLSSIDEEENSVSPLRDLIEEDITNENGYKAINDQDDDGEHRKEPPSEPSLMEFIRREDRLLVKLAGTAGTWFLFDVLFYGNSLFQNVVLAEAFGNSETVMKVIRDQLLIALIALPGYFVSVAVIGKVSPKYVQIQGFVLMAILYFVIGLGFDQLTSHRYLLLILYGLTFFFANFGPNATTFAMPSLTYSPACRSTLNGISAACGKAGALIGASTFAPLATTLGDASIMLICASISVIGIILTVSCVTELDEINPDIHVESGTAAKRGLKREKSRRRKSEKHLYGPLRNGESRKSFRGLEFWRRRNHSYPSLVDFDE